MSERVFSPWTWIYALVKRVPDTPPRTLSHSVVFPEMKRKRVHDVHPTVPLPREIVILTFPLPLCTRSSVPIPRLVLILLLLCAIFCAFPPPLTQLISLHSTFLARTRSWNTMCVKLFVSCLVSTLMIAILLFFIDK